MNETPLKKSKITPCAYPTMTSSELSFPNHLLSGVGTKERKMEDDIISEQEEKKSEDGIVGKTCHLIGNKYLDAFDYDRAEKWFQASVDARYKPSTLILSSILFGRRRRGDVGKDEACFVLFSSGCMLEGNSYLFKRAGCCLVRQLLSGFLSKNQTSSLHNSFFRSSLCEVLLLPLIVRYITHPGDMDIECWDETLAKSGKRVVLKYTNDVNELILRDCSELTKLSITSRISSVIPFIPLLSLPSLSEFSVSFGRKDKYMAVNRLFQALSMIGPFDHLISLRVSGYDVNENVDIYSILSKFNTSQLTEFHWDNVGVHLPSFSRLDWSSLKRLCLTCTGVTIPSISSLSQCNFKCLSDLKIGYRYSNYNSAPIHGLSNLDGLTPNITKHLTTLEIAGTDITDISALSICDFSHLQELWITGRVLSDLSPFSSCNFPLLSKLYLHDGKFLDLTPLAHAKMPVLKTIKFARTDVTDISPLCDIEGFAPNILDFSHCRVRDLSPLFRMNLSCLEEPVYLFPLEFDTSDLEMVDASNTGEYPFFVYISPYCGAAKQFKNDGLTDPVVIGNMTILWKFEHKFVWKQ